MDQTFLLQLNRWNEEEEYKKIIEAVEALPEEEKTRACLCICLLEAETACDAVYGPRRFCHRDEKQERL